MRFIHAAPRQGLLAPGSKICQTLMKTCYKPYNMLGSLEFTDFAASSTKIAPKTHKYSPTGAGGFAEVLQAVTCFFCVKSRCTLAYMLESLISLHLKRTADCRGNSARQFPFPLCLESTLLSRSQSRWSNSRVPTKGCFVW